MRKGISFVILTWNSKQYIRNCLDSVLDLAGFALEIIVIDNGSVDGTPQIIRQEYPEVVLIELYKNYGTTYTRNLGLKKANPEHQYICILDSDTIINQNATENLIACLEAHPSYMIAVPRMHNISKEYQLSVKKFPTVSIKVLKAIPLKVFNQLGRKMESYDFNMGKDIYEIDYGISACWMMKREILERVGYLDEKIFYAPEDVDYCVRVWENGGKVLLATKSVIVHDTQRISKKKFFSKINFSHLAGLLYYFKKHRYIFSARKIRN